MKNTWEWDENDLLELIKQQRAEGFDLDYKACAALLGKEQLKPGGKDEISKDVSSFANSAGGTLVYGVLENAEHLPTALDEGFDPNVFSEEKLEQMIASRIQPRIVDVKINRIQLSTRPGRVAYAVSIPAGKKAHQSWDRKYYKRFNYQSVPMEDHEIRDVNRRSESPKLKLEWTPLEVIQPTEPARFSMETKLGCLISNESPMPANHAIVLFYIDSRLQIVGVGDAKLSGDGTITEEGEVFNVKVYSYIWAVHFGHKSIPIFETAPPLQLMEHPIRIAIPKGKGRYAVGWDMRSPGMTPIKSFSFLESDDVKLSFKPHESSKFSE